MTHAFAWTGRMVGDISNKNKGKAGGKLSPRRKPSGHMQAPASVLCCLSVAVQGKYRQREGGGGEKIYIFIYLF